MSLGRDFNPYRRSCFAWPRDGSVGKSLRRGHVRAREACVLPDAALKTSQKYTQLQ